MAICIYKTDIHWHQYLGKLKAPEVYFWRSRMDKLGVNPNDWFYFMCREQNVIVGRARFRGLDESTVSGAWLAYGNKCGAKDEVDFLGLIKDALKLESVEDKIQCIKLDNAQWLSEASYIPLTDDLFSNIEAECPFRTDSISEQSAINLNNRFYNILRRSLKQ